MAPILASDTIKRLSVLGGGKARTSIAQRPSSVGFVSPSTTPRGSRKVGSLLCSTHEEHAAPGLLTEDYSGIPGAQRGSLSSATSPTTAPTSPSPELKRASGHLLTTGETPDPKRSSAMSPPGGSAKQAPESMLYRQKAGVASAWCNMPTPVKKRGRRFKLIDAPENPQKPLDLEMKLKTARDRSSDLQDIFTSKCSEETDRLRAQLASLTIHADELRARISLLEREIQDVHANRINDTHRAADDEPLKDASLIISVQREDPLAALQSRLGALEDPSSTKSVQQRASQIVLFRRQKSDKDDTGSKPLSRALSVSDTIDEDPYTAASAQVAYAAASSIQVRDEESQLAELDAEVAFGSGASNMEADSQSTTMRLPPGPQDQQDMSPSRRQSGANAYQDEVLAHVLHRRRAEARFREVSSVHENSIQQMENEQKEIERRMQKQQNWMKNVDEQVLQAEITKSKFQVRLQSAQQRVKAVGGELTKAYENMALLLQERLKVEDMATYNEALVAYLHVMGQADSLNDSHFISNKKELLSLMDTSSRAQKMRAYSEELEGDVSQMQTVVMEAVKHTEDMQRLAEQLHQLWNIIPVDWKDSVFKHVQKGFMAPLAMHPVNAIQALQTAAAAIHASQKQYYRALLEFLPRQD